MDLLYIVATAEEYVSQLFVEDDDEAMTPIWRCEEAINQVRWPASDWRPQRHSAFRFYNDPAVEELCPDLPHWTGDGWRPTL